MQDVLNAHCVLVFNQTEFFSPLTSLVASGRNYNFDCTSSAEHHVNAL